MCLVLRVPTYVHAHARVQTHAVVKLAAHSYTHVGGTRVCAQMSASGRSLDVGSRMYGNICMGKKNHPSRSRPSEVGSGGRTMFWASFLYGRARHKIDERLWLIYYAEKNALKFIMIGVRLTIFFFIASSTRTFLPIVLECGRRSDYEDYEWS